DRGRRSGLVDAGMDLDRWSGVGVRQRPDDSTPHGGRRASLPARCDLLWRRPLPAAVVVRARPLAGGLASPSRMLAACPRAASDRSSAIGAALRRWDASRLPV